jgi:hypothetical protein
LVYDVDQTTVDALDVLLAHGHNQATVVLAVEHGFALDVPISVRNVYVFLQYVLDDLAIGV